jgi:hypothetical protein
VLLTTVADEGHNFPEQTAAEFAFLFEQLGVRVR